MAIMEEGTKTEMVELRLCLFDHHFRRPDVNGNRAVGPNAGEPRAIEARFDGWPSDSYKCRRCVLVRVVSDPNYVAGFYD
jgi:hypothetical protein